jgi:hypothetical protein
VSPGHRPRRCGPPVLPLGVRRCGGRRT